jgi:hypothetical protein
MLIREVIAFYESHKLIPGTNVTCNNLDLIVVITRAFELSEPFGLFVRETLVPIDRNTFRLNFELWEELLNCYCSFMAGYNGNR